MTETPNYKLKKPDSTDTVDISVLNGNAETLDSELDKLSGALALIQRGDEATQNIEKGQYVLWKGVLCVASDNITSGETLSASNLTSVSGGISNVLSGLFKIKTITVLSGSPGTHNIETNISEDGWTAIGIAGYQAWNDYAGCNNMYSCYIVIPSQTLVYAINASPGGDVGAKIRVLYVSNKILPQFSTDE